MADGSSPFNSILNWSTVIPMVIYSFYCVVLCSLTIELAVPQDRAWLRRLLQFLIIGLFMTGLVWYTTFPLS